MNTLSKEDVVQLIEELGAGSNWLSGKHNVYSYNRQPKIAAMFLKAFAEQGLLELIAELRKPHNWKIEGFGHFKDVKMHQSDAPFRAASALEHFAALARADLVAENERLKEKLRTQRPYNGRAMSVQDHDEITDKLRAALAAAEAREIKLRGWLVWWCKFDSLNMDLKKWLAFSAEYKAFNRDDSALREMIAGVYEECAKACRKEAVVIVVDGKEERAYNNAISDCELAIRALAEKAKGK